MTACPDGRRSVPCQLCRARPRGRRRPFRKSPPTLFGRDGFVFDRVAGTMTRVSLGRTGAQPNHDIDGGEAISADGGTVAFATEATNLVPADTNGTTDRLRPHAGRPVASRGEGAPLRGPLRCPAGHRA